MCLVPVVGVDLFSTLKSSTEHWKGWRVARRILQALYQPGNYNIKTSLLMLKLPFCSSHSAVWLVEFPALYVLYARWLALTSDLNIDIDSDL